MPDKTEHIQLALHDIDVAHHLLEIPEYRDWVAITIFYSALHIVEAVFFSHATNEKTRHGRSHDCREAILKGTKSYQKIWGHYRELLSASIIARYLEGRGGRTVLFNIYMSESKVRERLIKHHFHQLIKSAIKFLPQKSSDLINLMFNKNFITAQDPKNEQS